MLTPILLILLPSLGNMFSHMWIHVVILIIALPVALYAIVLKGENKRIVALAIAGMTILTIAVAIELIEGGTIVHHESHGHIINPHTLNILGGILLGLSHFLNGYSTTSEPS